MNLLGGKTGGRVTVPWVIFVFYCVCSECVTNTHTNTHTGRLDEQHVSFATAKLKALGVRLVRGTRVRPPHLAVFDNYSYRRRSHGMALPDSEPESRIPFRAGYSSETD